MEPSVHEVLNWQGNSSGDMNATSGAVAGPVAAAAEDLVQLRAELKAAQAQVDAAAADKAWGAVEELMKRVNNLREKIDRLTGSAQDGAGAGSAGDVRPADGDTMVAPPGGWGALLVCSELRLDQLPQDATAVRELLGDFTGMRIPLAQPAYDTLMSDSGRRHMKDTFVRSNELNPLLTTLVMERKSLSLTSTELNTSFAVISFFTAVFDTLREYSPVVLSDLLFLNSSERGTSSTSISKGKRPDTLVQVNSTTLLVGEEKPLVGLLFAIEDLRKKIVNLNRSHFGDVPFVLAWAASGSQIQFFIATANDKLEAVTEPWDYLSFQGRVRLIFTLAQVYRLLHVMARCLPSSVVQRQPGSKLERDSGATVLFLDDSVTKTIADFKSYCKRYGTTLAAIKKAYSAAPQPGRDVHQFLAHASTGPTDTEDKYSVVVRPLGYDVTDRAQDIRGIARACCLAAQALHAKQIVHRDIREANVVCVAKGQYMVIDLEMAAKVDSQTPRGLLLAGWQRDTLEPSSSTRHKFTRLSDMYMIGLMLERMAGSEMDGNLRDFVGQLLAKQLTADAALAHPFLA